MLSRSARIPAHPFQNGSTFKSTRWDAIQVAYFTSAAIWNYLTEPFVFTYPGVPGSKIAPWQETRAHLAAAGREVSIEPIANHNADQVFYYDKDYMLRRMDYSPDSTTGNPPVAHYTRDPKTFDGFVFPTRRLVHLHNAKGIADQSFAAMPSTSTRSRSNRPSNVKQGDLQMPLVTIHVLEGRYDERRLSNVSKAVQDAQISLLKIPADDFFQIIHVLPRDRFCTRRRFSG